MDKQKFQNQQMVSAKSRVLAAVLCLFFGYLGVHRFYVGKIGTGLLWMITLGLFSFGQIIDFILILCGSFTDKQGDPIR